MSYLRELKRRLRFKLIKLEEAKFDAYVRAFRLIRNKILDDSDVTDKEKQRARFDVEDMEAGAKTTADAEATYPGLLVPRRPSILDELSQSLKPPKKALVFFPTRDFFGMASSLSTLPPPMIT
jgi:hypothetical protein